MGESVAKELGLDEAYTQLLPADKVEQVEALLLEKSAQRRSWPSWGTASTTRRCSPGPTSASPWAALGSDAAIEAADVVLMDDKPSKIAEAIRDRPASTLGIVRQNIVFALAVKLLVLVLGAFGLANMWEAVFADVGVMVLAILNASRALKAGREDTGKN